MTQALIYPITGDSPVIYGLGCFLLLVALGTIFVGFSLALGGLLTNNQDFRRLGVTMVVGSAIAFPMIAMVHKAIDILF